MKIIALTALMLILTTSGIVVDFGKKGNVNNWNIVNDGVMGGLSQSKAKVYKEYVEFGGEVSLDNNGGFASFCSPYGEYDLSDYAQVEIKYALDGQPCALTFENDYRYYFPNHKTFLPVTEGEWKVMTISLTDFEKYRMGVKQGVKMTEDQLKSITRMRFIVANKKAGKFNLKVDYLKFS
ncbi:MAG: CIA30 family protein [Bacteroidia bacterium]